MEAEMINRTLLSLLVKGVFLFMLAVLLVLMSLFGGR